MLRRTAARRVIRQAALFAGMMSLQPLPLLDIPVQAMIQAGVVMRVGAAYGHPPAGGISREIVGAVAGALGVHYLAQTLLKFIPFLGWAISGVIGLVATLLIGEAAIRYYEAGGTVPLPEWFSTQKLRWRNRKPPAGIKQRFQERARRRRQEVGADDPSSEDSSEPVKPGNQRFHFRRPDWLRRKVEVEPAIEEIPVTGDE